MKVNFNVSDIASLTGYNKYKTSLEILDLIITYFYKTYPELKSDNNYISIKDQYKENLNKLSLDNKNIINKLMSESLDSSDKLKNTTDQIKNIVNDVTSLDIADKKIITDYITNSNNKNYGTYNENNTIKKCNDKSEYTITDNNSELYIYESDKFNTRGMIDGYCMYDGEKHIVEIKNRKNRIFNFIPIYERIQVYYYMKSCYIDKVLFIQMKDDDIDESVIDDIDEELFEETQCRLNIICDLIDELKSDKKLRDAIIDKKNIDTLTDYIYWG